MDILLIGGSGQVGTELRLLGCPPGVRVLAPKRDELDLTNSTQIVSYISARPWAAVINAAAYTKVDEAERQPEPAFAINAAGVSCLAEETNRCGIPLVHLSTDYIFDGEKGEPYDETDAAAPINTYGRSKEAGEHAVRSCNPRHVIVRTAWIYSPFGTNFLKTMLRLARTRTHVEVVDDQRGNPTAAREVAEACLAVATHVACKPDRGPYGTYHFAGTGEATWCTLARAIFEGARRHSLDPPNVRAITSAEYPTPARRPIDTRLNCKAAEQDWGMRAQPWPKALEHTLARLFQKEIV